MRPYDGPRAVATTIEEFRRSGGGGGGEPPEEQNWLKQQVRRWAEKLMNREEAEIKKENAVSLTHYPDNRFRLLQLKEQFKRVSDTSADGTREAIRVIARYGFGLRVRQFD